MSGTATSDRSLARRLVSCAARRAPPELSERLQEEWLSDLMARRGAAARIRFGLGCCWATRVIAREFGAAAAGVGSSPSGQRLLVGYGGPDFSRLYRRTSAMVAIVCLHLGILYLYLNAFAPAGMVSHSKPITGGVITVHRDPRKPAPLPQPTLATPRVNDVPTPEIPFRLAADPKTIAVSHSVSRSAGPVSLSARPVDRVPGGPGAGFPDTEDYYPPAARRLGQEGAAAVRVCVDANGRLTAAPRILQSSGIARLDAGALRLAAAGSGHYRPTTENGRPVSSCYAFRIRFQLENP